MGTIKYLNDTKAQELVTEVKSRLATKANQSTTYTKTEVDNIVAAASTSAYHPSGSCAFDNLPALTEANLGNVYNVTDAFVTTTDFIEGAGKSIVAGTNVAIVKVTGSDPAVYKYDASSGMVDLTSYQTSNLGSPVTIDGTSVSTVEGAVGALNNSKVNESDMVAITTAELQAMWAD